MAKAKDRLVSVAKTFLSIAERAQRLSDEYKSNVSLSTSVYKTIPVTAATDSSLSNKVTIAVFLAFAVIAIIVAITVTVKSQKKFAFNKFAKEDKETETPIVDASDSNDENVDSDESKNE